MKSLIIITDLGEMFFLDQQEKLKPKIINKVGQGTLSSPVEKQAISGYCSRCVCRF